MSISIERILQALSHSARPVTVPAEEFMAAAEGLAARIQVTAPAVEPTDPSKPWI